jgi:hypothetical protein
MLTRMAEPVKAPQISLVAAAFGAVTGIITSFIFEPITSRIPVPLVADFVKDLLKPFLPFAAAVIFGLAATRIKRLDHFLSRHIGYAAPAAAVILSATVWIRAGSPTGLWQIATTILVAVVTLTFLLFCASLVARGMQVIAEAQKKEYGDRREAEAQDIAMDAIALGEPDAAAATFGLNLAGEMSGALAGGCFLFFVSGFNFLAIWAAVSLTAFVLYQVSLVWSVATGFVMALAALAAVSWSMEVGEKHAHQVPVDEKYKPIRGEPEP